MTGLLFAQCVKFRGLAQAPRSTVSPTNSAEEPGKWNCEVDKHLRLSGVEEGSDDLVDTLLALQSTEPTVSAAADNAKRNKKIFFAANAVRLRQ